jgi:hypothetical protein
MTQRVFIEFAVDVADNLELLEILSGMKVSIAGDHVISWELAHASHDDSPIVSNFLK